MMASVDQHSNSWDQVSVPVVPTLLSEEQFENWMLANRELRAEWVNGKVIVISPVSHVHNALSIWLTHLISAFLELRPLGELLGPEFMVRLAGVKCRRVPDLLFVANDRRALIKETYLDGAPDLAVEIVSQDSPARDWREVFGK
jgi:Uma2 family endonuclease